MRIEKRIPSGRDPRVGGFGQGETTSTRERAAVPRQFRNFYSRGASSHTNERIITEPGTKPAAAASVMGFRRSRTTLISSRDCFWAPKIREFRYKLEWRKFFPERKPSVLCPMLKR